MISTLAVLLLVLGATQAQNNVTCCPPDFAGLGYDALLDFQFDYYYDGETGNSLAIRRSGGDLQMLFEASSGSSYARTGDSCTVEIKPELIGLKLCALADSKFIGAEILDGQTYYEWHVMYGKITGSLVVDDHCLSKISHGILAKAPIYSNVLFNLVPFADVSIIDSFDKTGCVALN